MRVVLIVVMLLASSCSYMREQADFVENKKVIARRDSILAEYRFDTAYAYKQQICLLYKHKPLLKIGQHISEFPSDITCRNVYEISESYKGAASYYWANYDDMSINTRDITANGSLFILEENIGNRIFALSASWLIYKNYSKSGIHDALNALKKKVPSCLPSAKELLKRHSVKIDNGEFAENYELTLPDSTTFDRYCLDYSISLNPKQHK